MLTPCVRHRFKGKGGRMEGGREEGAEGGWVGVCGEWRLC